MELIIVSDNFKRLIGLLINANVKFHIGKLHENYHVVSYREYTSGVQKLWEVDDRPKHLYFYDLITGYASYELSLEEIVEYISIIEEKT